MTSFGPFRSFFLVVSKFVLLVLQIDICKIKSNEKINFKLHLLHQHLHLELISLQLTLHTIAAQRLHVGLAHQRLRSRLAASAQLLLQKGGRVGVGQVQVLQQALVLLGLALRVHQLVLQGLHLFLHRLQLVAGEFGRVPQLLAEGVMADKGPG